MKHTPTTLSKFKSFLPCFRHCGLSSTKVPNLLTCHPRAIALRPLHSICIVCNTVILEYTYYDYILQIISYGLTCIILYIYIVLSHKSSSDIHYIWCSWHVSEQKYRYFFFSPTTIDFFGLTTTTDIHFLDTFCVLCVSLAYFFLL
jgi:hypothetical protein